MASSDNMKISESIDTTSVSMSAASSATMIGFSATIITLIVTLVKEPEISTSIIYILIFYILAIIFFIFTTEFFILAAWNKENYVTWGTIGSIAYGLGLGWIIIGISLTFDILVHLSQVAYLTMTLFLLGYIIYYLLRWKIKKEEPYIKTRIAVRALMMLQIVIGYVALYLLD
ncbi:MAG: hypothetical protein O8C61_01445 [Candidatus Methanoperedens sp.]|nr:hypothetical protein [Candidatus Methanoperedens sp.]